MAVAWFIASYTQSKLNGKPSRAPATSAFIAQVTADGGAVAWTEVLGNRALVKVRASAATLTAIAAAAGVIELPLTLLATSCSTLSAAKRQAIITALEGLGYTSAEVTAALGDLTTVTFGQVLDFAASRRLQERYDVASDSIVCDGPVLSCVPPADVDGSV